MLVRRLRSILALTWMEMLGISYCCGSLVISTTNGIENFVQNEISSLCGRSMRATCSYRIKPMDFEDDLIDAHIRLQTQSFRKGRGGQPVNCMITLLVILLDMPIMINA